MATIAAKAARRARVNERLTILSGHLAQEFGIDVPPVSGTTRDQELDQIVELERIATIFEGILSGVGDAENVEAIDVTVLSRPYRAAEFLEEFGDLETVKQIAAIAGVDADALEATDDPRAVADLIGERINDDEFDFAEFGVTEDGRILDLGAPESEEEVATAEESEVETSGETDADTEDAETPVDLTSLSLGDLKQRAIEAGHDADRVNKKRSKKEVIKLLNGEGGA